jgi:DNA-binding transcriptional LysR family regulator
MDLRQIQYAEAIARHANFTRAARELHVAQPALSVAVKSLEEELGVKLFVRTSRRVSLTDAGTAFIERARGILRNLDGLAFEMAEYSGATRGRVRVGSAYHLDPRMPGVLSAFVRENPLVEISIVDEPSSRMLDGLRSADLDVAFPILSLDADLTDLGHVVIGEDRLVMVVARGDPLTSLASVPLRAITTRPFIVCGSGTALREWLDDALARAGVKTNIAIETSGIGAMVEYASIGLGTTIATTSIIGAVARQVAMVPIEDAPTFKLCLAWNARRHRSPVAERFLSLARSMLATPADQP